MSDEVCAAWDELVQSWIADDSLPLIVRKSTGARGAVVQHKGGRDIIIADNSPAHWAFTQAYSGIRYSTADIHRLLAEDALPVRYASKTDDKGKIKYTCCLGKDNNVNASDWKLCHIDDIGMRTRIPLTAVPIERLTLHFRLLISPSNHFIVPLDWSGLGEVPEVLEAIKRSNNRVEGNCDPRRSSAQYATRRAAGHSPLTLDVGVQTDGQWFAAVCQAQTLRIPEHP